MLIESSELVDLLDVVTKCYFESMSGPGIEIQFFMPSNTRKRPTYFSLTLDSDDHSDCCRGEDWNI